METTQNPTASFLGIEFDLTILFMCLLTVLLIFSFVFWASRKMTLKPKGKQNVLAWIYEFIQNTIQSSLADYTKNYTLFAFVLFTFIFVANNIGLITKIQLGDYNFWTSQTSNFGITFGLALMVFVISHVEGIRKNGFIGYLKGYLAPMPALLPMNILEEFTNVISLSLRLFGNIYSGEIMITLLLQFAHMNNFTGPIAFVLNMVWTAFSLFVGSIQAFVFVLLSSNYIGNKVNGEEE